MNVKFDSILRAVSARLWAIDPEKGQEVMDFLAFRASGGMLSAADIAAISAQNKRPAMQVKGAVAVLPVYGVIAPRMNMMTEMSGGTSLELLGAQFDALVEDPKIGAIVLDFDSPGGTVQGVPEMASKIEAARGTKPIIASVNHLAASAALWLASKADNIAISPSAQIGSIGVYNVHFDESGAMEKEGIKATIVQAGKYKTEGNPWQPLSDEAKAHLQQNVDNIYADFVRAVAKGRGVTQATVLSDYGQGRVLDAKQAVKVGMADRIATLYEVLGELTGGKRRAVKPIRAESISGIAATLGVPSTAHTYEVPTTTMGAHTITLVAGGAPAPADDGDDDADEENDNDADDPPTKKKSKAKATRPTNNDGPEDPDNEDDEEPDDEQDSEARATAGGAAVIADGIAPHPPAPKAKENTVDNPTAAQTGAAESTVPALLALAAEHGKGVTDITRWVSEKKSVADVRAELLGEYKAKHSAQPSISVGDTRETKKPFATGGEFLKAVAGAAARPDRIDPRLLPLAAASGASESVGADGAFLVYPEFSNQLIYRTYEQGQVLSRCRRIPIGTPNGSLVIPAVDETSRADGKRWGGVTVQWANEADTASSSKPAFRRLEIKPEKLLASFFATDELLQDTTALEAYATYAFQSEMTFKLEDGILNGGGAGQMLGVLNGPALVTVAKESGQAAATVLANNVIKMRARMWAPLRRGAVWFINQDVEPQLMTMFIPNTTIPIYTPAGGLSGAPYATLFGNPIVPIEQCATVGTSGDLIFASMEEYLIVERGGPTMAQSIHVKFLTDEMAFRFTHRVGGQPLWNSVLTPKNGTNTLAPWVVLAAR